MADGDFEGERRVSSFILSPQELLLEHVGAGKAPQHAKRSLHQERLADGRLAAKVLGNPRLGETQQPSQCPLAPRTTDGLRHALVVLPPSGHAGSISRPRLDGQPFYAAVAANSAGGDVL